MKKCRLGGAQRGEIRTELMCSFITASGERGL